MNGSATTVKIYTHGRGALAWLCAALAVLSGCVSDEAKRDAINAVNAEFRAQYERILAEKGTRTYSLRRDDAFSAMSKTLADLGMHPESIDQSLGVMTFSATAPTPLSNADWRTTAAADLPKLREIVRPYLGFFARFIKFEPEGLEIVINSTILDSPEGAVQISLTMRMRQIEPPHSGMPRRDYPPPTGMRIGLDKVWTQFDSVTERRQALPR